MWRRNAAVAVVVSGVVFVMRGTTRAQDTSSEGGPAGGQPAGIAISRIERRLVALERALMWSQGAWTQAALQKDSERMSALLALLVLSTTRAPFALAEDGRCDLFKPCVRGGSTEQEMIELMTSARYGVGPSPSDVPQRLYARVPYERFRGAAIKGTKVPLLWDAIPHVGRKRLVGLSDGSVVIMAEDDLDALLIRFDQ